MSYSLEKKNFGSVRTLILCMGFWFYINLYFGYLLSKFFINFFENTSKKQIDKNRFINLLKLLLELFCKSFTDWLKQVKERFFMFKTTFEIFLKTIKIFYRKIIRIYQRKMKFHLKIKSIFRKLKRLLLTFCDTYLTFRAFLNELFFLANLVNWLIGWKNFIQLLINESIILTRIGFSLYFIFLGIFGTFLGFIFGLYWLEDEIFLFLFWLLLKIFYNTKFNDIFSKILKNYSFCNIEEFSIFFPENFKSHPSYSSKWLLSEFHEKSQIPFPILKDPFLFIDVNFVKEEFTDYKLELFYFWHQMGQKIEK